MDQQLRQVAETLNKSGLEWWLDCGTLLAVVRDGGVLFSQDPDIDLSAWVDQPEALARSFEMLRHHGYRVRSRRYRGEIARYWIKPPRGSRLRSIDLKLFTRQGELATSPATVSRTRGRPGSLRYIVSEAIRVPLASAWNRRFSRARRLRFPEVDLVVASWVIPCEYLTPIEELDLEGARLRRPGNIDAYLAYRYGDWRTPNRDWVTARDDGGLVLDTPANATRSVGPHDT